ncbi:MAG: alpha/beta hydrolase [Clostridia bacterium]|nr:alpha/beta hydrolase [Clostridia bacterium]
MNGGEELRQVTVNGVRLHYAVAGAGRPIVLAHGNGEDHHLFDTEIRQLTAAGYRVYAPDSRGHGANAPVAEYHYADMAEDMAQFIEALRLEKPAFYGHSDGGIVGLLLAIRHPEALGALIISGTNLSPAGLDPAFLAECEERNQQFDDPLVTLMLTEPHIDPRLLRDVSIPVLVTAGERDLILPSETRRIADALPRADVKIVAGADHGSYIKDSDVMGRLLIDFLAEVWKEHACGEGG